MPTLTVVQTFMSSSSDKVYTVKRDVVSGALSCDCPGWRFAKPGQERGCKHTKEVQSTWESGKETTPSSTGAIPSSVHRQKGSNPEDEAVATAQTKDSASANVQGKATSPFAPMLADAAPVAFDDANFVFEPKLDGIRAIAEISPDGVKLWGRNGTNYAPSFPEVTPALHALISQSKDAYLVLDGEIVAFKNGVADFGATSGRAHSSPIKARLQANVSPAVYHAFDVLQVGRRKLVSTPQSERREILEAIFRSRRDVGGKRIVVGEQQSLALVNQRRDGVAFFQEIIAAGGEGIMAKRRDGLYRPGKRHSDWTKVKGVQSDTFVVIGLTKGTGWRSSIFGAVVLAEQNTFGKLIEVGEAGTGFDNAALANVLASAMPHVAKGPPPGIQDRSDILHWLRPVLQAEIKFHARTADGKLRFPVFKGLRRDL